MQGDQSRSGRHDKNIHTKKINHGSSRGYLLWSTHQEERLQERPEKRLGGSDTIIAEHPPGEYLKPNEHRHKPLSGDCARADGVHKDDKYSKINNPTKALCYNNDSQSLLNCEKASTRECEYLDTNIDLRAKREILRHSLHRFLYKLEENIPNQHLQRDYLKSLCTTGFITSLRKLFQLIKKHNFRRDDYPVNGLYDDLSFPALNLKTKELEKWKKRSVQERIMIKRLTKEKRQLEKNFLSVYATAKLELEAKKTQIENLQKEVASSRVQIIELKRIIRERCRSLFSSVKYMH